MGKVNIIKQDRVFDDYFKVDKAEISHEIDSRVYKYSRLKLNRPNAVTVLLYNKDTDSVILVKQFRYPIYDNSPNGGYIYEVIAGKMDENETPEQTAIREVCEESGYIISENNLIPLGYSFASPGYSSEKIYQYAAVVTSKQKKQKGGGKEDECEDIEIIHVPYLYFRSWIENGSLLDMKTKLSYFESSLAGVFNQKKEKKAKLKAIKIDNKNQINLNI